MKIPDRAAKIVLTKRIVFQVTNMKDKNGFNHFISDNERTQRSETNIWSAERWIENGQ